MNSPPKPQPESSTQEVLAGIVERVTYHNAENGFCVLRIAARGHRDLVTVVGHAASISAGEWITAAGDWVNDRTHGQQFKARFMRTSAPTSIDGIEKYLSSGMIRGIGPVYAKKMVKAFGEKVFDIIEAEPDRLREVDGIGPVRAQRITAAWAEQKIVREIMVFLHSHGVGTVRAVRIFKTYGADAVQIMTENPYRLARDIRGIGFKTADAIAMKLGIEKTAVIRVRAGISYALTEAMDEGHCGLPVEELVPLAIELLEVDQGLVLTAMDLELADGSVIADSVGETACVFLGGLYRAEQVIAERLLRLANGTLPWPYIDPNKALPWIEQKTGLTLAESQIEAIRLALLSKVLVVTGGPGVGKTTIVNSILRILAAKGANLLLCAPTGRAAKRMTEATGFEAKTIHRLLEVDPKAAASNAAATIRSSATSSWWTRLDGRRHADAGAAQSGPRSCRAPDRRRHRPAALSRSGSGAGRRHRFCGGSRRALDRDIPTGRTEPYHHQCAQDQPGLHSRSLQARGRQRLLFRAGGRPRSGRLADHRTRENAYPAAVPSPSNPRHPGAMSDESRRRRCLLAEYRATGRARSRRRAQGRTLRLDLRSSDKVMQIENDYDKEVYNGDIGSIDDVDPDAGELTASFDGRVVTYGSANSTRWCRPTPQRSTNHRDRSTPPSSFR